MSTTYNMAPGIAEQPRLSMKQYKHAIYKLEMYYEYKNIVESKERLKRALINADDDIIEWVNNMRTPPQTWEELIRKLNEEMLDISFKNLANCQLGMNEKFSQWIKRTVKIAKEGCISLNLYRAIIRETVKKHPRALELIKVIMNKESYLEMEQAIRELETIEHNKRMTKHKAMKRIKKKGKE